MDKRKTELAEEQVYELRKTVRYDIRELTIEIIVDKYQKGVDYDPENVISNTINNYNTLWVPDYQRDFTWDAIRQSRFIESVLLGLPIPLIFVAENRDSVWEIVDGSQRIRTLNAFINDNLTLSSLEKLDKLNNFKFSDLLPARQKKFKSIAIRMIVLSEDATDEIKKDMFERINRGSDLLKPMEKRKVSYKGPFNDFIYKRCAKNDTFRKLAPIDKWLENRQEREELILRFFAISDFHDNFPKSTGIAKFLDEYLDKQNKELSQMSDSEAKEKLDYLYERFEEMVDFVQKISTYGFRRTHNPQTKRIIFEAISVGVRLALDKKRDIQCSKERFDSILHSDIFDRMVIGNTSGAYQPQHVKERVNYIKDQLLNGNDKK